MDKIGYRIKKFRKARGMSQQELADAMQYRSRSTIAKLECGENDIPQAKIAEFAKVLGTTPAALMGFEEATELRKLRLVSGLPRELLSEELDVSPRTIAKWEQDGMPTDALQKYRSAIELLAAKADTEGKRWTVDATASELLVLELWRRLSPEGKAKAQQYLADLVALDSLRN